MVPTQDCRHAADRNTPLPSLSFISVRAALTLALSTLLVGVAVIPQAAGAAAATKTTTPTIKWNKSVSLENPKKAGSFDAVSCTMATTNAKTGKTSTTLTDKQFCVAADSSGNIWWTTTPWKNHTAWKRVTIDKIKHASLTAISCATTTFCVAVDNRGYVISSTKPNGGAKYWSKPVLADTTVAAGGGPAGFAGISCPTVKLCVAVDNASQVVTSTNPTGAASAWTVTAIPDTPALTSVACASTTLCVLGGSTRYESITPTAGATAWTARGAIVGGVLESLVCPNITLCVGVGYGDTTTGLASVTATPSGPTSGWVNTTIVTSVPAGNSQLLDSVACPAATFCVAVDGADDAYDTVSPVTGGWASIKPARKLATSAWSAISCDVKNCLVADSRGFVTSGTLKNIPVASPTPTTTTTNTTTTTTPTTTAGTTNTN
jgi:hypothetical protein